MPDDRPGRPEADRIRLDFVTEAEDILEALSDDLRELEASFSSGGSHLELVNTVFGQVHSLKGFAGLLGFPQIVSLAHALEDLLSRLRLGAPLDGATLDLLHDALDALLGVVRDLRSGVATPRDLESLRDRLGRAAAAKAIPQGEGLDVLDLPEFVRASLTEHEEGRLRAVLALGSRLSLVRVRPDPRSLEEHLQEVARRIAASGELISTVPVVGEEGEAGIAFDLLVASPLPLLASDLPQEIVAGIREFSMGQPPARPSAGIPPEAARTSAGAPLAPSNDLERFEDLAGPSSSLRVPVARLDQVLAQVGDLSIAVASLDRGVRTLRERHPDNRLARDLAPRVRNVLNRLRALQRGAIDARLVPLEQVFRNAGRMVARAARASRKEVDLHMLGADTEIDKSVMDALTPSLMHLVANALDHGIEPPEERERAGKSRRGRVVLSAFRRGSSVIIDVIDDGRGIAIEAVKAAAAARGLIPKDRDMTLEEAHEMIFRPGFSTATTLSEVSGRGVGMDVVRRSIGRVKGAIVVRSVEGQGTTFTVTVPISLALVPAIIVQARGQRFAIPVASIRENVRIDGARVRDGGGGEVYDRPEGPLPLLRLDRLLRRSSGPEEPRVPEPGRYAVVTGSGKRTLGIVVDGFVGRQEVVVKPVGRWIRDLPGVAGAADLGDATAVLVLDPEAFLEGERNGRALS
jgi:two-component system chemotaxis sensor kinase CheA